MDSALFLHISFAYCAYVFAYICNPQNQYAKKYATPRAKTNIMRAAE